jgi:Uma2 family endonuclease
MPADAMTLEQAARLNPDAQPGELVDGKWVSATRNTWNHGELAGNVYAILRTWAKGHPGWSLSLNDPGSKLSQSPATLRGPDVGMVRKERRPTGTGIGGWLDGAPDLAVEVKGDGQSFAELTRKAIEYLRASASLVWILDGAQHELVVFTPPDHVRVLGANDTLDGGALLPGFRCVVSELFELLP